MHLEDHKIEQLHTYNGQKCLIRWWMFEQIEECTLGKSHNWTITDFHDDTCNISGRNKQTPKNHTPWHSHNSTNSSLNDCTPERSHSLIVTHQKITHPNYCFHELSLTWTITHLNDKTPTKLHTSTTTHRYNHTPHVFADKLSQGAALIVKYLSKC